MSDQIVVWGLGAPEPEPEPGRQPRFMWLLSTNYDDYDNNSSTPLGVYGDLAQAMIAGDDYAERLAHPYRLAAWVDRYEGDEAFYASILYDRVVTSEYLSVTASATARRP